MSRRIFIALSALATLAWADDAQPHKMADHMAQKLAERFQQADTNHDGQLSQAEAEQGMPRLAKHFAGIDSDKKGFVTLAQVQAFMQQQMAQRAHHKPEQAN